MRSLTLFLTLIALVAAPASASARSPHRDAPRHEAPNSRVFAQTQAVPHGIAGDRGTVFLTQGGIDGPASVVALDRRTGRQIAELPAPTGGLRLPFALRISRPGRLVLLDNGGFPPVAPPTIHEYEYRRVGGTVRAQLVRSIPLTGVPIAFAEDLIVLPNGGYLLSDSTVGGFFYVDPAGTAHTALVPGPGEGGKLSPCGYTGAPFTVAGRPFTIAGGFLPGVGTLALRAGWVYFGTNCQGGLQRIPLATILDQRRPATARAARVETVSPARPGPPVDLLHGLAVDPESPGEPYLYAGMPFSLQVTRIDLRTGARTVVGDDPRLFNFPVVTAFLPQEGGRRSLLVVSDQEHNWTGTNPALSANRFERPFVITEIGLGRRSN